MNGRLFEVEGMAEGKAERGWAEWNVLFPILPTERDERDPNNNITNNKGEQNNGHFSYCMCERFENCDTQVYA